MRKDILKYALINATLTVFYIGLVASFLFNVERLFPQEPQTMLVPMLMLMLFVFSAALTGTLVFGRPILWYIDGKKKEAVTLLCYTFSIFFAAMFLGFIVLTIIT